MLGMAKPPSAVSFKVGRFSGLCLQEQLVQMIEKPP
jgi:hypothetical protein